MSINKVPNSLVLKGKYGSRLSDSEIIQIPELTYPQTKYYNPKPFIVMEKLSDIYLKVKDTSSEAGFWNDVLSKYEKGDISGYNTEDVYELEDGSFIVTTIVKFADLIFWESVDLEDEKYHEKELDWLENNTSNHPVYIDGEITNLFISIFDLTPEEIKIVENS